MGLLGEIFSASDSLKRRVKGLLSDPIGYLQQLDDQATGTAPWKPGEWRGLLSP